MKQKSFIVQLVCLAFSLHTHAQGTFVYDQQSINVVEGIAHINNANQPMGQSFTPSLSTVAFVDLYLYDADALHFAGATVTVNLRAGSVTGTLLGTSSSVTMPDQFFGIVNFVFSTPVSVVPESLYYFQPVVLAGDSWSDYVTDGSYTRGAQISSGLPVASRNLWFREGIIVPEPTSASLLFLGGGLAAWFVRRKR
ncbi:MAG: PEP-CTERM sorting domain-containing protein [Verrucomicrobiales bacterium]|nr:MAG: PEP-CTERM sorting domain-containing protein [Verrucomicrobiales bacterium]